MKQIQITEKEGMQTVNARELWEELQSKRKYADWIKDKIESCFFTQDIDYIVFHNFVKDGTAFGGKRKTIDYFISIDMAKELCMLENNEKGREIRKYFIECERRLKETKKPMSIEEMTKTVLKYYEEKTKELENKIEEDKPKVEFFEKVADSTNYQSMQAFSKAIGIGSNTLFALLREKNIFYKKDNFNLPLQKYIDKEYFVVREEVFKNKDKYETYFRIFITGKGQQWLERKLVQFEKEENN